MTLATNDSYALGALTLAQSLKRVQTSKGLVVMITSEVSQEIKSVLEETFEKVVVVDPLDSKDIVNLKLLARTELGITFTKVNKDRQFFFKNNSVRLEFHILDPLLDTDRVQQVRLPGR